MLPPACAIDMRMVGPRSIGGSVLHGRDFFQAPVASEMEKRWRSHGTE